ncbi:MAG: SAM-dependent methyltransferase [Candidatus Aenigmarchaeota archaeon]|nr:SAM-dependent methyltransferase [Candidatus Aenigmarchaeota archaeon]
METYPAPMTIKNLPKVGVFASRSQYRPNKIALRLVKLEKIEKNVLYVKGLDAINKTPVIDIKPYIKEFDRPLKFKQAPWYCWLK